MPGGEPSYVSHGARAIHEYLKEHKSVPVSHAQEIAITAGVEPENLNYAIMYGGGRRGWWYRQGDELYLKETPAAANGHNPGAAIPAGYPEPSFENLESPADSFAQLCVRLGVTPRVASVVANYISEVAVMDDPPSLWKALSAATEVSPSQKQRIFHAWTSHRGLAVHPQLAQTVQSAAPAAYSYQQPQPQPTEPPRRYTIGIDGRPEPLPPGEEGYTWKEAWDIFRVEHQSQNQGDNSVLPALVQWMSESQRTQMETLKSLTHREPGPLDQMTSHVLQKAVEALTSPHPTPTMITMKDGESLPFESFLKLQDLQLRQQELETKRGLVNYAMSAIPDLLSSGARAHAELRGQQPAAHQQGNAQQAGVTTRKSCISCGETLLVDSGWAYYTCPQCGVSQTATGLEVKIQQQQTGDAGEQDQSGIHQSDQVQQGPASQYPPAPPRTPQQPAPRFSGPTGDYWRDSTQQEA